MTFDEWRELVNRLTDLLDCTRAQAKRIVNAMVREGYALPLEVTR